MGNDETTEITTNNAVELGYEWHDVNVPMLLCWSLICLIAIVISIVVLDGYFVHYREQLMRERNSYENSALTELRAAEQGTLTTYGVIDKEKGVYRVPIERAMQIVAEEAFQREGKNLRK